MCRSIYVYHKVGHTRFLRILPHSEILELLLVDKSIFGRCVETNKSIL